MDIKLTVEAPGLVEALNNLANAMGHTETPVKAVEDKPKEEKKQKPKEEKKQEPKVEKEPEVKEDPPAEEKPTSQYTKELVTTKTREFIGSAGNRDKLKAFLDEKGVKRVSELPEEHYEAIIKFMENES